MAKGSCCVDGCTLDVLVISRQLCRIHYHRWKRTGTTELRPKVPHAPKPCSIDECEARAVGRGWCAKHWKRWQQHGDPMAVNNLPINYCSVEGCETRVEGYGLCRKHLRRHRRFGSFELPVKATVCAVEDCIAPRKYRDWCGKHYARWYNHGNPLTVLPNPMNLPRPPKPCKRRGCKRRHVAKGLCGKHYYKLRNREWVKANPDKVKAAGHRRRARLAGAPINDLTAQQWREIKAAYGYRCAYCGRRRKLSMDHVIPLSKGGSHTAANIVPACHPCNSGKCDREAPTYQPLLV